MVVVVVMMIVAVCVWLWLCVDKWVGLLCFGYRTKLMLSMIS